MIGPIEAMRRLQESAMRQSKLEDNLIDINPKITEHLLKCFLYKNTTNNLEHWKQDIYSFLHEVPVLKQNKKLPSYKFLINNTFNIYSEVLMNRLDAKIRDLIKKGYPEISNYNKQNLYSAIYNYYDWLCKLLASNGYIELSEICDKIDELINEYNF